MRVLLAFVVALACVALVSADGCNRKDTIFDQFDDRVKDVYDEDARKYFWHDYSVYKELAIDKSQAAQDAMKVNEDWLNAQYKAAEVRLRVTQAIQVTFGIPIVDHTKISMVHFTWAICRMKSQGTEEPLTDLSQCTLAGPEALKEWLDAQNKPTLEANKRMITEVVSHINKVKNYQQPDQAKRTVQAAISNVGLVKNLNLGFQNGALPGWPITEAIYKAAEGPCVGDAIAVTEARKKNIMTKLTVKPDADFSWCGVGSAALLAMTGVPVYWDATSQCPNLKKEWTGPEKWPSCKGMCPTDQQPLAALTNFDDLKMGDFLYWDCPNNHQSLLINKYTEDGKIIVRSVDHYAMLAGIDIGVRAVDGNGQMTDPAGKTYTSRMFQYKRPIK